MFSTIGCEKNNNARIANRSLKDFTDIMNRLKLPKPSMIDKAIPANLKLGLVSHAA